jgi:hypothetical protein
MATAVKYFDSARIAYGRQTTGVTATDGSGTGGTFTWYNATGGGSGAPTTDWMLTKIIFTSSSATGVGDLADCLIHIFVDDGTTSRIIRTIDVGNPAAGSTTVSAYQIEVNFGPEFIFPSTVLPEFTISVTPTAGNLDAVLYAQVS